MRSIPTGGDALVKAAVQNLGVDQQQATQFVYKFGLVKDKLEGQVLHAVQSVVDSLLDEIDKSIKFFTTRYQGVQLSKIIVTGKLATLPEFPLYLVNHAQIPVEIGNSWVNVGYSQSKTNDLAAISHEFSVAVGLAERIE
jgi:type IV pilus assembly protein PilM/plasmid segregation protein ParM